MKTYRLKIQPKGGFITPFQADTLFGSLCWVIRYREGIQYLKEMLQDFCTGNPWFIISNAFPGDLLPKPLIKIKRTAPVNWQEQLNLAREGKKLKKITYLSPEEYLQIVNGAVPTLKYKEKPTFMSATLHNQINRFLGTSAEGNGLYEQEECFLNPVYGYFSIYFKTAETDFANKLTAFMEELGKIGFGKKKSIGKGSFTLLDVECWDFFEAVENPNAFISLSNFVPAQGDPVDGNYRYLVKYGKLGEDLALSPNPYKSPLLMLEAGSAFRVPGEIKPFYGQMIKNIAPQHPEVVQYALAFSVGSRWEETN